MTAANWNQSGWPVFFSILFGFVVLYWALQQWSKQRKHPPGPWGLPLFGHILFLGSAPHKKLTEWSKTYGAVYGIRMGTRKALVVNNLTLMREALLKQKGDFDSRPDFESFKNIANGRNLAFAYSPLSWTLQKRVMKKSLTLYSRDPNHPIENFILEESNRLVEELLREAGSGQVNPVDPQKFITIAASSVIFHICFGTIKNPREFPEFEEIIRGFDEFNKAQSAGGNLVDFIPEVAFLFQHQLKKFRDHMKRASSLLHKLVDMTEKEFSPEIGVRNMTDAFNVVAAEISEEELTRSQYGRDEFRVMCQDLVGAGSTTVVSVMRWFVLFCAVHPHIQAKVRQEIWSAVGKERNIRNADRTKLPYTEATLLETMRVGVMFPFLLPHSAARDTTFQSYAAPEGTLLMCNMYAISRDPNLWSNPMEFQPERYLMEKSGEFVVNRDLTDQYPLFGLGTRRCPGENMGRQESFIMCATLIQKLNFSLVEGQTYRTDGVFTLSLDPHPYEVMISSANS